ncbi:MAG: alpha/beta hydrolase, partial [Rhodospirillaceae bacterium]|nr:alpha/beta hydrolase [Rhodospirillaceae bacterium]
MTSVYRDFDRDELWREYNIEATVPSIEPYRITNETITTEMKQKLVCHTDLAYGSSPAEILDIYPAQNSSDLSPVFVFIHGGYWHLGSKNGSGYMAKCLTENGVAVAPIDYALAPDVTLDEIVRQARSSVAWVYHHGEKFGIDKNQIHVAGTSAGGHLAAMIIAPGWQQDFSVPENLIKGAMLFSGLYDLEPLRHCEPNSWLKLDKEAADRNSPVYTLPTEKIPLVIAYGSEETP